MVTPTQQHTAPNDNNTSTPAPASASGLRAFALGPGGGATMAGACEIAVFHPFDTISKRLMANKAPVVVPGDFAATRRRAAEVIFYGGGGVGSVGVAATASSTSSSPFIATVACLYPGSVYAVYYKVLQRLVKFAGQPYAKDAMEALWSRYSSGGSNGGGGRLSERHRRLLLEACAGSVVGVCEVILLPIDRMKVLSQTNRAALEGVGVVHHAGGGVAGGGSGGIGSSGGGLKGLSALRHMLLKEKGGIRTMYAAAGTTALRNIVGSFLLFGGSAFTKEYAFGLQDYRAATVGQNMAASAVGACMGVLCTSPMDVVKTRLQCRNLLSAATAATATAASSSSSAAASSTASHVAAAAAPVTGSTIVIETLRREGPQAFFKGITPKIITTAPRLVFSYTLAQIFTQKLRTCN